MHGVYWGYNPLILTIDPNFQRDIQVAPNGNLVFDQLDALIQQGDSRQILETYVKLICMMFGQSFSILTNVEKQTKHGIFVRSLRLVRGFKGRHFAKPCLGFFG